MSRSTNTSYRSLPAHKNAQDDPDEVRSSTEIGDEEVSMKQGWQTAREGRRKRTEDARHEVTKRIRRYRWLIDMVLLVINITLSVLALALARERRSYRRDGRQVGGDYTGGGPEFDVRVTKWDAQKEFVPRDWPEWFSEKTLATWNTMMPHPTSSRMGLRNETFYSTSMTHQLHCLFMMGRIYAGVASNDTALLPTDFENHFLHCIDYMRQGVLCAGDVAIEEHAPTDSEDLGPLDGGWSGRHVCKDPGQVKSYLEKQVDDGIRVLLPIDD